jgi:hypothetical protein
MSPPEQTHKETTMLTTANYIMYLVLSIFTVAYVSSTLNRDGRTFLVEGFEGDNGLAYAISRLLMAGVYLVSLGFVLLRMRTRVQVETFEEMLVYQAEGLGLVLLVLGVGHFFSVNVVLRISRRGLGMYTRAGLK